MKLEKKITLLFYISGSLIFSLPFLLVLLLKLNITFLNNILLLFKINLNINTISLLIILTFLIILYDLFFFNNKKQVKKNFLLFENIFGSENNILYNFIISLLSGYFEELLFRGYLYYALITIFRLFIISSFYLDITIIIVISLLFALLHIIQGMEAFIVSFIISIAFFFSIKISSTILYAMSAHLLINFLELSIVIPYQKKHLEE